MKADLDPRFAGSGPLSIGPMQPADVRGRDAHRIAFFHDLVAAERFPQRAERQQARALLRGSSGRPAKRAIVAYGGIWVILEDSHVTTIAVHPDWRGKKYGEQVLVRLLREAIERGASWITLEARESNFVAQNLYRKYGFVTVSTRRALLQRQRRERGRDVGRQLARRTLSQPALAALESRLAHTLAIPGA